MENEIIINAQMEDNTQNAEEAPKPKVEHLFFSNNKDVLIKYSFPIEDGSVAYSYILIQAPTSKEGIDNVEKLKKTLLKSKDRYMIESSGE